jgi:hypothetical protein
MHNFARANFVAVMIAEKRKQGECQVSSRNIFVILLQVKKSFMFGLQRARVRQ